MRSRVEKFAVAPTDRDAEAQDHGLLLRLDLEETGEQEQDDQAGHHHLDDGEAALERIGERLRSGVLSAFERGRGMVMIMAVVVVVVRMVVLVAHAAIIVNTSPSPRPSPPGEGARWCRLF